jgi:hypothetical protein
LSNSEGSSILHGTVFHASQKTSSMVERHFRSTFLEACFRTWVFSLYQGAKFLRQIFFGFRGATAYMVLGKVTYSSSVRRLTYFCTPTSLGRWRESGRASRNLWVVQEFIAWLLIILGWGLNRLLVAIASVIKWWSDSPVI